MTHGGMQKSDILDCHCPGNNFYNAKDTLMV